jgi:hypothetical protein
LGRDSFDSTKPIPQLHPHTHKPLSAQHSALGTNIKKKQSEMQKMQENSVASELINFLNASPTAFHAVGNYLNN